MGARDVRQGVYLVDTHVHLVLNDEVEQLAGPVLELLAGDDVIEERGPHDAQVLGRELRDGEGGDGAGLCVFLVSNSSFILYTPTKGEDIYDHTTHRIPIADNRPLPLHNLQIVLELILPRTIKNHTHALPAGDRLDLPHQILLFFVINHLLRPILPRQVHLLLRARRPDRPRPHGPQQLAQPQAHAPRGSVHQDPIALLDQVRFADQGQGGQALQQRRGGDARRQGGRDEVCLGGGSAGVLGVGGRAHVDYPIADFDVVVQAGPEGEDGAFGFAAEDLGFGGGVEAGAEVAVGYVRRVF